MTYRLLFKNRGGDMIATAHSLAIETCGDHEIAHVHLIGKDMDGQPFCEIIVNEEQVMDMLDRIVHHQSRH